MLGLALSGPNCMKLTQTKPMQKRGERERRREGERERELSSGETKQFLIDTTKSWSN